MDSSAELHKGFLADITDISPMIEDYIAGQLYELEVEYSDGVDESVIFNLVLGMVLSELLTIGIDVLGGTDIYNDPEKIKLIKVIREKFDTRNIRRTLINNDAMRNNIMSASSEWDVENIVDTVAGIASAEQPLSVDWEYLKQHATEVVSTHDLERHLVRIIENIDNEVDPDVDDETVIEYTLAIAEQRIRFIENVTALREELTTIVGLDVVKSNTELDNSIIVYDVDLINNMDPDSSRIYMHEDDPHPAFRSDKQPDIALVQHHKKLHTHHAECLEIKSLLTGEVIDDAKYLVMLVSDGHRVTWSYERNMETFKKYTAELNLTDDAIALTEQWMRMLTT